MLSNVYVFTGNPFLVYHLRREWARKFREKHGAEGISTYDLVESGESNRLLQELTMQSFFVSKRLLIAEGNPFATAPKRGRKKKVVEAEEGIPPLLDALDVADEQTIIVFTEEGGGTAWPESIPTPNVRQLSATNGRVDGYDPKRSLPYDGFFAGIFGDSLSKEALSAVTRVVAEGARKDVEADLFAAFHALEQIAVLPRDEQTRANAVTFLNIIPEERGYELVTTLLSGKARQGIGMVESMLRQGMHARQIFRMVATQVLDLLEAKTLLGDHPSLSDAGLATKMGKTSWLAGKIAATAKRTDAARIADLQARLIAMNVAMNSGDLDTEREDDFLAAFATFTVRSAGGKGSTGNSRKPIPGPMPVAGRP